MQRVADVTAGALLLLYVVWILVVLPARHPLSHLAIISALALVAVFAARAAVGRPGSLRLGATAQALHYDMKVKGIVGFPLRRGESPWSQVYFDGTRLLAGPHLVAMTRPLLGQVFDAADLRRVVLAHVPPANVVTRGRLTRLAIGRQKARLLVIIALIAAAAAMAIASNERLL